MTDYGDHTPITVGAGTSRATATTCNNCHGPKPDDGFRACADCRAYWRARDKARGPRRVEQMRRTVAVDRDVLDRLTPAAKAHGMTVTALARLLLATIADHDLTRAILDDRAP